MTKTLDQLLTRSSLQMIAWLAQANTADADIANRKFPAHQVIQPPLASDNVAASFAGGKFDVIFALQRLDRLRLDQRKFEIRLRLEESALLKGVTISFKPDAGNQNRLIQSLNRPDGGGGDVDRLHFSV